MGWRSALFYGAGLAAASALLAACAEPPGKQGVAPDAGARRIVSLDYCADQYVLALADRGAIAALSPHAEEDYAHLRREAAGLAKVRPRAEDVLALRPDLVVRTYGGGPKAAALYEAAGVPVLQIGYASDLAAVRTVLRDAAAGLGAQDRGAALIAEMDARLAAINARRDNKDAQRPASALYITPGGVTAGAGTLIDEMIAAAGYHNFSAAPGWRALPLEQLAREKPDFLAASFFASSARDLDAWSPARHPVIRSLMEKTPTVALTSASTSCNAWYLVGAVEALAAGPDAGEK
ncbi:MAG: ABC transporter substrate-binding protein [Pseudomonadota bacterium]